VHGHYIKKGDLIKGRDKLAVDVSNDYTRMIYDDYDFKLSRSGYEGGRAVGYVDVLLQESGRRATVSMGWVERVEQ